MTDKPPKGQPQGPLPFGKTPVQLRKEKQERALALAKKEITPEQYQAWLKSLEGAGN